VDSKSPPLPCISDRAVSAVFLKNESVWSAKLPKSSVVGPRKRDFLSELISTLFARHVGVLQPAPLAEGQHWNAG
jgi:hypothetical protein